MANLSVFVYCVETLVWRRRVISLEYLAHAAARVSYMSEEEYEKRSERRRSKGSVLAR